MKTLICIVVGIGISLTLGCENEPPKKTKPAASKISASEYWASKTKNLCHGRPPKTQK